MIDILIDKIIEKNNPSAIGLDTCLDYLPKELRSRATDFESAADCIFEYNKNIIDAVKDIVPAVKVQVAYYEAYSYFGMRAFYQTLALAKQNNLIVISDVKRNDIGSTAAHYSSAYLGNTVINGEKLSAFPSDFVTLNAYLGYDGIEPFCKDIEKNKKGAFILCRTSNKSGAELQNLTLDSGSSVYLHMGKLIKKWGTPFIGKYGYSSVGAVVGATNPSEAQILRRNLKSTFFLIPGYGFQGGGASDLAVCFDSRGLGGIVNSSRGILCAYSQEKYKGLDYASAARAAAIDMKDDLNSQIKVNL